MGLVIGVKRREIWPICLNATAGEHRVKLSGPFENYLSRGFDDAILTFPGDRVFPWGADGRQARRASAPATTRQGPLLQSAL